MKTWKQFIFPALALVLGFSCSKPEPRPIFDKSKRSSNGPKAPHTVGPVAVDKVDPQKLKDTTEKILAPASDGCSTAAKAADPSLRLLTKVEYNNSIRDLFGLTKDYADSLPSEIRVKGFKNNAQTNLVSDAHMDAFMRAAKVIAEDISGKFQDITGCPLQAGESCAQTVIAGLGPKIWRRPLSSDESARLLSVFKVGAQVSPGAGFQLLFRALLSSPHFLYRQELGQGGALTAYESAHALSFFFWASVPDDELRKLASTGEILKNDIMLAQARRLLASPKAKAGLRELIDALMAYTRVETVGKDTQKFPQFTAGLRKAMIAETEDTFDYWIREKNIKFQDLFTADYSIGNAELATFYNAKTNQDNGREILRFSESKRRGLLGFGSFLAGFSATDSTNPIKRGMYIREHLLCEILAVPDGEIPPVPVASGLSTRERFAQHSANPACKTCHQRIDSIGFGMEDFDAVGLYRDQEAGKPLDSSGDVYDLDGREKNVFNGAEGLSNILKTSDRAKRCFVPQTFRAASGRFENAGDVCALRSIADDFVKRDASLSELLIHLMTNGSLLQRKEL